MLRKHYAQKTSCLKTLRIKKDNVPDGRCLFLNYVKVKLIISKIQGQKASFSFYYQNLSADLSLAKRFLDFFCVSIKEAFNQPAPYKAFESVLALC